MNPRPQTLQLRATGRRQSGFTLLELMVVIVIVGILVGFLVMNGASAFNQAEEKETGVRLDTLSSLILAYRSVEGEFPDDRLPRNASSNTVNGCSEALVLAFFDPGFTGGKPKQEWLVNTDSDSSSRQMTSFGNKQLFELADGWGNPIMYFENLHYNRSVTCMAGMDGDHLEQTVTAARDEKTGSYLSPSGFQLISAGLDGEFDTEDDIIRSN
jgi:prepilin-type N-terminal cleavage/methylation domain-containing protein